MNNDNNNEIQKETPNKEFFKDIVQEANLPEEKVHKEIPNLDKASKNDTIEPVKTASDQDKIDAYDKLEVKDLPDDWKTQLLRLKHLEKELSNYTETKEKLKGWVDTFEEKKPVQVQEEIKQLEENKKQTEEQLKTRIQELEQDLDKSVLESQNILKELGGKIKELEIESGEWKGFFSERELKEVKEEWELLNKRPDLPISEQKFYGDFAQRPTPIDNENLKQKLEKEKEQVIKLQEEKKELQKNIDDYLESERIKKYVLAESVVTSEQAQNAIVKLLGRTKQKWMNYLDDSNNIAEKELKLKLSLDNEDKISRAKQVVAWITEAQINQNYQTLFERWSLGKEFNKEYDYDAGSLKLLGKYLEVINNAKHE